jgi:hypothetical protein
VQKAVKAAIVGRLQAREGTKLAAGGTSLRACHADPIARDGDCSWGQVFGASKVRSRELVPARIRERQTSTN